MFLSGMLARRRTQVKANSWAWLTGAVRWAPAIVWMGGIFYLSHQSAPLGASARPWESIVAHLGLYAGLNVLLCWALGARTTGGRLPARRMVIAAFALTVLYGASDELHQAFVPGRTASMVDTALDAGGAVLGVFALVAGSGILGAPGARS